MTPQEQRVAIASSHGWDDIRVDVDWLPEETSGLFSFPHPTKPGKIKRCINRKKIPDYLNDRDAMVEAILCLPDDKRRKFGGWLKYVMVIWGDINDLDLIYVSVTAPLDILAQAYLRTVGLWKD